MKLSQFARVGVLALAVAAASCGSAVRSGTGTSFLVVEGIEFARGFDVDTYHSNLVSDVVTVIDGASGSWGDLARVTFSLGLKDPGTATNPNAPTQNQRITINRFNVRYTRADGRNTPGVDVPYPFDGACTVTIPANGTAQCGFVVVRNTAKNEAPLARLAFTPEIITMIIEMTFYGVDQTGHEVSVTARGTGDFGNFGDPRQ
jgi:hypothetical protein